MLLLVTLGWCGVSVVAAALWAVACSGARARADEERFASESTGQVPVSLPAPRSTHEPEPAAV